MYVFGCDQAFGFLVFLTWLSIAFDFYSMFPSNRLFALWLAHTSSYVRIIATFTHLTRYFNLDWFYVCYV